MFVRILAPVSVILFGKKKKILAVTIKLGIFRQENYGLPKWALNSVSVLQEKRGIHKHTEEKMK